MWILENTGCQRNKNNEIKPLSNKIFSKHNQEQSAQTVFHRLGICAKIFSFFLRCEKTLISVTPVNSTKKISCLHLLESKWSVWLLIII